MLIAVLGFGVGAGSAAGSSENPAGSAVSTVDAPNTGVIKNVVSADSVVIGNFAFGPVSLVAAPGKKITVINQDRASHALTARDKSFDTGTIAGGQRGEIRCVPG